MIGTIGNFSKFVYLFGQTTRQALPYNRVLFNDIAKRSFTSSREVKVQPVGNRDVIDLKNTLFKEYTFTFSNSKKIFF